VISDLPANRSIPSFSSEPAKTVDSGLCHQIGQNRRIQLYRQIGRHHQIGLCHQIGQTGRSPFSSESAKPPIPPFRQQRHDRASRASHEHRACRQLSLDNRPSNQVKISERSTGSEALFTTPSCGPRAPDVERARCKRSREGVQHQGLVDHRYQARRAWHVQAGAVSAWDRGATAPGKTGEHTATPRRRSFGARKAPPAKRSTVLPRGQAATTTQLPARRGGLTTKRPKGHAQRARHHRGAG
jgi:hypothetical protein